MASRKTDENDSIALPALLSQLSIEQWDYLILGDGSGSNFNRCCGWASVSIERLTGERLVWYGAMNCGTVNIAELMAYLQPINWIAGRQAKRRKQNQQYFRDCHIHCISDSRYCTENGQANEIPTRNNGFWELASSFQQQGLHLHWHWIERSSWALNQWADQLARISKRALQQVHLTEWHDGESATVYDINPEA